MVKMKSQFDCSVFNSWHVLRIWPILSSATGLLVILTLFEYKNPRIKAQIMHLPMREEISVIF